MNECDKIEMWQKASALGYKVDLVIMSSQKGHFTIYEKGSIHPYNIYTIEGVYGFVKGYALARGIVE